MPTQKPQKSADDGASKNILYVVLHGLITLVDVGEKGFIAFLLDMGKEHKYLVGDWLVETEIPKRKYWKRPLHAVLENVDKEQISAQNFLDPDQNAVAKQSQPPDVMHSQVRAVFNLPRPHSIQHFTIGKVTAGTIRDDLQELVKEPSHLAGIRVFQYTFQNPKRPDSPLLHKLHRKSDLPPLWQCPEELALVKDDKGQLFNVAVLHIYNQPGAKLPPGSPHNREEFNNSASLLGTQVTLVQDTVPDNEKKLPAGILQGEVECLYGRGKFAVHYLNQVRMTQSKSDLGRGAGGCGSELCAACDGVVIHGFNERFYLKEKLR
jgi:hypothetical protein